MLILNDNLEEPESGKAKIHFVNFSPDGGAIRLKVKGESTSLAQDEDFKEATEFFEVDSKAFDFEVVSADNGDVKLQISDVELQDGWFILVKGYTTRQREIRMC